MLRVEKSTSRLFVCKSPQCFIASKLNRQAVRIFFRQLRASRNNILFYFCNFTLPWIINKKIFSCFHRNLSERCNSTENYLFCEQPVCRDAPRCRLSAREICVALFWLFSVCCCFSDRSAAVFASSASDSRHANASLCSLSQAFLTLSSKTETQQRSFEHHPMFIINDVKCFGHCSQIWMDSGMTLDPRAPYLRICSHVHV